MRRERGGSRLRGRRQRRDRDRRLQSRRLRRVVASLRLLVRRLSSCRLVPLLRWRRQCHLANRHLQNCGVWQQDKLYVWCRSPCKVGRPVVTYRRSLSFQNGSTYRLRLGLGSSIAEVDVKHRGSGRVSVRVPTWAPLAARSRRGGGRCCGGGGATPSAATGRGGCWNGGLTAGAVGTGAAVADVACAA